jgi:hypothetical protein
MSETAVEVGDGEERLSREVQPTTWLGYVMVGSY